MSAITAVAQFSKRYSVRLIIGALVAYGIGLVVGYSPISYGDPLCNTLTSTSAIPNGYGSPFNVLSATQELLLSASCGGTSAMILIGSGASNQYVYQYGYEWRNNQWNRITYTGGGALIANAWYTGLASATVARTAAEMMSDNYVVGYVCQNSNNTWKCGCRDAQCATGMWQVQVFNAKAAVSTTLPTAGSILDSKGTLMIAYPGPYSGPPGTQVTLTGQGFAPTGNTVLFGSYTIPNINSNAGTMLAFTVPMNAVPGRYTVDVRVGNATSTNSVGFMVTTPGASRPTITSITPNHGANNTQVTITGSNFTPTGNYLLTTFGKIENIPSPDGITMTLPLNLFPNNPTWEYNGVPQSRGTKDFSTHIYVMNTNGVSVQQVVFKVKI